MQRGVMLALVVVLVAAGCGDDDDGSDSFSASRSASGSASAAEAEAPVELSGTVNNHGSTDLSGEDGAAVEMELDDFYFGPTFVKGAPGQAIKVVLENEGKANHTFTIDSLSIDETLSPGDKKEVEVKVPDSGVLTYYCRFHDAQGMKGAFYRAGAGSPSPSTTAPSVGGY